MLLWQVKDCYNIEKAIGTHEAILIAVNVLVLQEALQWYDDWNSNKNNIQTDGINLQKTLMFTCMSKINFIIHFSPFYRILQFDWSTAFGPITENHNFARYGIGGEISKAIPFFILDYFQEKLMRKFYKKHKKTLFLGPFWTIVAQIIAKMNFPRKNSNLLRYSNYLSSCKKIRKKLMTHS